MGKIPLIKKFSFKGFRTAIFICFVFCLFVWRRETDSAAAKPSVQALGPWDQDWLAEFLYNPPVMTSSKLQICHCKSHCLNTLWVNTAFQKWFKKIPIISLTTILRVNLEKQMSRARLEFTPALVPTSNFQSTKWGKARVLSQGSFSPEVTSHSWPLGGKRWRSFALEWAEVGKALDMSLGSRD